MSDDHATKARELFDEISSERDEWARNRRIGKITAALRAAAEAEREAFFDEMIDQINVCDLGLVKSQTFKIIAENAYDSRKRKAGAK
jgi:transcriptional regulator of NAD metabolism